MITIDALLKDGLPALHDLDGSSPGGGQVTTRSAQRTELRPGDVVRDDGAWSVVSDVRHNGIHGITVAALIRADGSAVVRTLTSCDGAEVRTDARIDADTLWTLTDARTCVPHAGEHGAASCPDRA